MYCPAPIQRVLSVQTLITFLEMKQGKYWIYVLKQCETQQWHCNGDEEIKVFCRQSAYRRTQRFRSPQISIGFLGFHHDA